MVALKKVSIDENQLCELPSQFGKLVNLEELNLGKTNNLQKLYHYEGNLFTVILLILVLLGLNYLRCITFKSLIILVFVSCQLYQLISETYIREKVYNFIMYSEHV